MKKILATILSLIFLFSICVGCKKDDKNDGFVAVAKIQYTFNDESISKVSTRNSVFYYYNALGKRCERSSAEIGYGEAKQLSDGFKRCSENKSSEIKKANLIPEKHYGKTSFVVEREVDDFYSVLLYSFTFGEYSERRYWRIKYYGYAYSIVYVRKNKDNTIDIKDNKGITTIPSSVPYMVTELI